MNEQERKKYLENLKNNLTIDQVYDFLADAGGEPHQSRDNIIVSRTICHNPPGQGSYKLYYYDNTKLFKCYTQCPEGSFDIFQLTLKIKRLANEQIVYYSSQGEQVARPWNLPDAVRYVAAYYGIEPPDENFSEKRIELQDWQILSKLEAKKHQKISKQIVSLKTFEDDFLDHLSQPRILPWEKEGITPEVMRIHKICYDPKYQGIVIPHYDINNNLIGVRERTLIKENESKGKYTPAIINGKMYNHPLSFNLYNINIAKDNIRRMKTVIIFEGEKSCLKFGSFFGIENDISVGTCGSNLINYQFELLENLGVKELVICFDKQYKEIGDEEWKLWQRKLISINNKYCERMQISFVLDKSDTLGYKDSPIDRGPQVFLDLYNRRVIK